ncbi:methyltransferase family protein [Flagellimonas flava]|uniref:Protein-S-isoprenylcysteine O-methyltransferase Ste14 n=1 Tax=Flagellimonas flava TaxID=570519 RepID=A0A1M5N049_9FLAO|nr:methyltransferase [Allomuricauda flava]SHG82918.1 Protein-S-isoprenylcysteine O-methyltransferase Ste14 [Allomuricauda flava]
MKGTAYLVQSTLILLWWLGLSMSPDFFEAFQFPGISAMAFNSFFAPDIIIIALFSLMRAYKTSRQLELIILGGFAYGSFYCLNASILSGGGYLSTVIMMLGLCYNLFLVFQNTVFRESQSDSITQNTLKTLLQIICVWTITLVLFPWLIIKAFDIEMATNPLNHIAGFALFILSSLLGLYSAYSLITKGNGTPLPANQTKKLVLHGPYAYIRNPMAVAGMGQGLAVSLYVGSFHIFCYTILGGLIWHLVVRPIEEKNMLLRFGTDYADYKKRVRCWLPKF